MTVQKILLGFESEKKNLLRALKEINRVFGFISFSAIRQTARYFNLSEAAVFSVASFYDELSIKKPKGLLIELCDGSNCLTRGVDKIISVIENYFHQRVGDEFNPKVEIRIISCLGRCAQGPVMVVNGTVYEKVDVAKAIEILKNYID